MSLSTALEKLMQLLNKNAMLQDDVQAILHRVINEFGDLEATVTELVDKVEALEDRESNRDEQTAEIDERVSEIEARLPNLDET